MTLHRLIAREALARLPIEIRPRRLDSRLPATSLDATGSAEQIQRAIDSEWAVTVEDLVRRRTSLAVRGLDDAPTRARLGRLLEEAGYAAAADQRDRGPLGPPATQEPKEAVMATKPPDFLR